MIYPHMTYAVTVWGASNLTNRKLIVKSQRKFLKLIPMQLNAIYETYHLMKFGDIHKYFTCIKISQSFTSPKLEVFKSYFQQLIPPHNHETRTRLNNVLNIPRMRLSKFKSSFLYNAIVHYIDLPADIKNCRSISTFKRKLTKFKGLYSFLITIQRLRYKLRKILLLWLINFYPFDTNRNNKKIVYSYTTNLSEFHSNHIFLRLFI